MQKNRFFYQKSKPASANIKPPDGAAPSWKDAPSYFDNELLRKVYDQLYAEAEEKKEVKSVILVLMSLFVLFLCFFKKNFFLIFIQNFNYFL